MSTFAFRNDNKTVVTKLGMRDGGYRTGGKPIHDYHIKSGGEEARLSVVPDGKDLYVHNISSSNPNTMGPKAMRTVLRHMKNEFPNAETVSGLGESGARTKMYERRDPDDYDPDFVRFKIR